jgi:hypothetical protein
VKTATRLFYGFLSSRADEFLNGEILGSMKELRIHDNTARPYSSLGYRSPAPAAWLTESSQRHIYHPLRYTNDPAGTKDRTGQLRQLIGGTGVAERQQFQMEI